MGKPSPLFALIDSISETKQDLIRTGAARVSDYNPFMTNRSFSYHPDSVLFANEMNTLRGLPKIMQYDYYMESLRPRRRWSKFYKSERLEIERALAIVYGYSPAKCREVIPILSDDDVKMILQQARGTEQ